MPSMPRTVRHAGQSSRSEQNRAHWKRSDEDRGSAVDRGYDRKWSKARLGYLAKHPLCCCCEANGYVTVAAHLDHVVPHKGDRALFWDRDNWQGLCAPCHLRIKPILERRFADGRIAAADLRMARPLPEFFPILGAM